jgi:glycosyltransferase involved in cell wall biosynthesis
MMKTKIFIVTTYFPPIVSIASNRMEAFAKYLNRELFDIEVITLSESNKPEIETLDSDIKVYRLPNNTLFKKAGFLKTRNIITHKLKAAYNKIFFALFKNEFSSWQKEVEKLLFSKIKNEPNCIVISSFAPSAAHSSVLSLKKKGLSFKWIADFRDSMTNPSVSDSLINVYEKIQNNVILLADAVTSVSKPILEEFKKIKPSGFYTEIRNGYDFTLPEKYVFNDCFTISYVGSFYGKRKPFTFFQALKNIIENHSDFVFKLNLVGVGKSIQIPEFLKDKTNFTFKISHEEALKSMIEADALLLIHPETEYKGVYTGKIFEYLASLKPIIAVVDKKDVAAELILECNSGFVASFNNVSEIEESILKAYNLWKQKSRLEVNLELIKQHHRKVQVEKLNSLILNILKKDKLL